MPPYDLHKQMSPSVRRFSVLRLYIVDDSDKTIISSPKSFPAKSNNEKHGYI